MSELNTSNISVPNIATMARHLTDADPHPQYMQASSLLSAISATVHLADLADVTYGSGIAEKSLLYYTGSGFWGVTTASDLLADAVVPYATVNTPGIVKLTQSTLVGEANDSSSVITPYTLNVWGSSKEFLSSGNLLTTISNVFSDHSIQAPLDLAQIRNVGLTSNIVVGQVLAVHSYDSVFNSCTWANSDVVVPKANRSTFGVVEVASPEEVLSGTSMTYAEMELSGHKVPSLASIAALAGVRYVSRCTATSSAVYNAIVGHEVVDGSGYTTYGVSTFINAGGLVADHIVRAGILTVNDGMVVSAVVSGSAVIIGSAASNVNGSVNVTSTGKAYNLLVGSRGVVAVTGEACDVYISGGYDPAVGGYAYDNAFSNSIDVNSNGHAHQVTVGTFYDENTLINLLVSNNAMIQGTLNVNSRGCVEHATVNARASANVNYCGNAYHITVRGDGAKITVNSRGYVEDLRCYSGASVVVATGAEVNGMVVYGDTTLIVESGARIGGLVKYGVCHISSAPGAMIDRAGFVTSDLKVYSSSSDNCNVSSSISGGLVLAFSAGTHPTGLRREELIVSGGSSSIAHLFVPMAVETRIPTPGDPDVNEYTMNISGLSLWDDIVSSGETVAWYVTF